MNLHEMPPSFRLAGLIAAHEGGRVDGRLRLQKTVYLLQEAGVPLGYDFTMLHYGPYSEGLRAETRMLTKIRLLEEDERDVHVGTRFRLTATEEARMLAPVVDELDAAEKLRTIAAADTDTLELAATYRYYRELGYAEDEAIRALRSKKAGKVSDRSEAQALDLLDRLGIPQ